jgi:group I intron endonuclease
MYTIYHAWCEPSQKSYVGQTKQGLARRKAVHFADALRDNGRPFCRAIKHHKRPAFAWQELATVETKAEADNLEKLWIALLNTTDKSIGYNLTTGGGGYEFTEEAKARVRKNTPRGEKHAFHKSNRPLPELCRINSAKVRVAKYAAMRKQKEIEKQNKPKYVAPTGEKHPLYLVVDTEEIIRLHQQGLGTRKIATALGVSKPLIARRLKSAGVIMRPTGRPKKGD